MGSDSGPLGKIYQLNNHLEDTLKLRRNGCLLQVNLYDLKEENDYERIRDWARRLVGEVSRSAQHGLS